MLLVYVWCVDVMFCMFVCVSDFWTEYKCNLLHLLWIMCLVWCVHFKRFYSWFENAGFQWYGKAFLFFGCDEWGSNPNTRKFYLIYFVNIHMKLFEFNITGMCYFYSFIFINKTNYMIIIKISYCFPILLHSHSYNFYRNLWEMKSGQP
jgi:hypothetical protein